MYKLKRTKKHVAFLQQPNPAFSFLWILFLSVYYLFKHLLSKYLFNERLCYKTMFIKPYNLVNVFFFLKEVKNHFKTLSNISKISEPFSSLIGSTHTIYMLAHRYTHTCTHVDTHTDLSLQLLILQALYTAVSLFSDFSLGQ